MWQHLLGFTSCSWEAGRGRIATVAAAGYVCQLGLLLAASWHLSALRWLRYVCLVVPCTLDPRGTGSPQWEFILLSAACLSKRTRAWLALNRCRHWASAVVVFRLFNVPYLSRFFHDVMSHWSSSVGHVLCIDLCLKIHSQIFYQWLLLRVKCIVLLVLLSSLHLQRDISRVITHFSLIFYSRLTLPLKNLTSEGAATWF